jgi:AraC-like DNA-binding protein
MLSAIVEGTNLVSRPPVAELQPYLGCFWALVHAPGTTVQTLPDASAYLVIEMPDAVPPRCIVAGPRLKTVRSAPTERSNVVGIRLRPGVGFLLTGAPADQLVGHREPLAKFLGACADELAEQIAKANSTEARFDLLESFLLKHLAAKRLDERVVLALRLIEQSAGAIQVEQLARRCGVSARQLERLLRTWIGIAPKRLARIARFQAVLGHAGKQPTSQWTHVAAEQNYVDQAHLIHEFSGFTGASPTRFPALNSNNSVKPNCD